MVSHVCDRVFGEVKIRFNSMTHNLLEASVLLQVDIDEFAKKTFKKI